MTALFWGSFATVRGLAVFGAIVLSPDVIMWTSLLTALGKFIFKYIPVSVEVLDCSIF
jgi:hypothetical protein